MKDTETQYWVNQLKRGMAASFSAADVKKLSVKDVTDYAKLLAKRWQLKHEMVSIDSSLSNCRKLRGAESQALTALENAVAKGVKGALGGSSDLWRKVHERDKKLIPVKRAELSKRKAECAKLGSLHERTARKEKAATERMLKKREILKRKLARLSK